MRLFKHVNFRAAVLSVAFLHSTVWAAATLENPTAGALKSGVGLISGWICEADRLEVSLDGGARLFVPYGSDRTNPARHCPSFCTAPPPPFYGISISCQLPSP